MRKEEFTLPEKWCIKANPEIVNILAEYWDKGCRTTCYKTLILDYINSYWYSHNLVSGNPLFSSYSGSNHTLNRVIHGFTEITFKQFKEYVLKETKIYTIQDLIDGKVVCVNNGTLEELREVLETAFPKSGRPFGTGTNYVKSIYYENSWIADEHNTGLPKQSVKEFYKQLKNNTMNTNKIFPLKLSPENAQAIIDIACSSWKNKLAARWASNIVLKEVIPVNEEAYKEMRKSCTHQQHELFDKIFGKDESFPPKGTICRVWIPGTSEGSIYLGLSDGKGGFHNDGTNLNNYDLKFTHYEVLTSLDQFK